MPISFSNQAHDDRREKHFRVTVAMGAYDTGTVGTSGGAVTPNGNFPNASKYPYMQIVVQNRALQPQSLSLQKLRLN